jgi:hypothetical protein
MVLAPTLTNVGAQLGLVIELRLVEQDHDTPPVVAGTLSALGARAQARLDANREIAHGIYPPDRPRLMRHRGPGRLWTGPVD